MNWMFFILTTVLMVAQICLDYLLKFIFKDARTSEHKTFRRILLGVTLATFFVGLVCSIQKERKDEAVRDGLAGQLISVNASNTNLVQEVKSLRLDNSKQRKAISDLMQAHIDNETADLVSRSRMLDAKNMYELGEARAGEWDDLISKFQSKRSQLNLDLERERLKTVEEQKRYLGPLHRAWEYSIRTYHTMLVDYARKQTSAKVTSNFISFPSLDNLCAGYTVKTGTYGKYVDVCEISLGTNYVWMCKCRLWIPDRMGTAGHYPSLNFECNGKKGSELLALGVSTSNDKLVTALQGREPHPISSECPIGDYKKGVDEALQNLIAAEDDEFSSSSK